LVIGGILLLPLFSFEQTGTFAPFDFDLPAGTQIHTEGTTLKFSLPNGYYILAIESNGDYVRANEGGVTCSCTSGSGGCSPVKKGNEYGCLMTSCGECKQTKLMRKANGQYAEVTDFIVVNENGSDFVNTFEQIIGKRLLPGRFIGSEEVRSFINELQRNALPSSSNNTKTILVLHLGYVIPVTIPDDIDNTSVSFVSGSPGFPDDPNAGPRCDCEQGSSCPLRKQLMVVYCDADNCKVCSMRGRIIQSNGEIRELIARNGKIQLN